MSIFLTFIIPVYNSENTILPCVQSIIESSFKVNLKIQIILINDGSIDNSWDIIKSLSADYDFISAYSQKNLGVSAARNLGLQHVLGDYVCFVDVDDLIHENYIYSVFEMTRNMEIIDMIQIGYQRVSDINNYVITPYQNRLYYDVNLYFKRNMNTHAVWSYIFSRALIESHKLRFNESLRYSEDQDFLIQSFTYSESIATIKDALYLYNDIATSAVNKRITYERAEVHLIILKSILNEYERLSHFHIYLIERLVFSYFQYGKRVTEINMSNLLSSYKGFVCSINNSDLLINNQKLLRVINKPFLLKRYYINYANFCIFYRRNLIKLYSKYNGLWRK